MTTEQNRARLLQMTRGHEDAVLLFRVGYMIVAVPVEDTDGKADAVPDSCIMPCEPQAMQSIFDAVDARIAARRSNTAAQRIDAAAGAGSGKTPRFLCFMGNVYDDTANDADIAEAMATRTCLVNYGGKLRATNLHARAEGVAIIVKNMQRT